MSNRSIKRRIEESLALFRAGKIDIKSLISSVENNGHALEMMPYNLVKEIDEIEHQLTISQFYGEEGCNLDIDGALRTLESWLSKVPIESIEKDK